MSLLSYKYYDTPEGHDIYKKVFVTSKYAAVTGLTAASFDVLLYSHPQTILAAGGRYLFYLGPLVGMATAFTVTTNVSQSIRGKNDIWNYFLGGAAAGSIFGAWNRSILAGVPAAVILGCIAAIKKVGVDEGFTFLPPVHQATENAISAKFDFSWVKDVPEFKNFTTGSK